MHAPSLIEGGYCRSRPVSDARGPNVDPAQIIVRNPSRPNHWRPPLRAAWRFQARRHRSQRAIAIITMESGPNDIMGMGGTGLSSHDCVTSGCFFLRSGAAFRGRRPTGPGPERHPAADSVRGSAGRGFRHRNSGSRLREAPRVGGFLRRSLLVPGCGDSASSIHPRARRALLREVPHPPAPPVLERLRVDSPTCSHRDAIGQQRLPAPDRIACQNRVVLPVGYRPVWRARPHSRARSTRKAVGPRCNHRRKGRSSVRRRCGSARRRWRYTGACGRPGKRHFPGLRARRPGSGDSVRTGSSQNQSQPARHGGERHKDGTPSGGASSFRWRPGVIATP
jgi:hypothetical protein